jgi:hypothetical protein
VSTYGTSRIGTTHGITAESGRSSGFSQPPITDSNDSRSLRTDTQHKGQLRSGGGNHRGSIFRLIVGAALIGHDGLQCPTWGDGNTAAKEVRAGEVALEGAVSLFIREMPFLSLSIGDEAGPQSVRGYIERNSIAVLSNYGKPPLDPPSPCWLGHHSDRERVRRSGLWNQNHVDESYEARFLDRLDDLVSDADAAA